MRRSALGRSAALLLLALLPASGALAGPVQTRNAGFSMASLADPGNPPLVVAIWYPTDAPEKPDQIGLDRVGVAPDAPVRGQDLRLIMIAHGLGGGYADHTDTAIALAQAGFVVATPRFTGDTVRENGRMLRVWDRTRQLRRVTDWMLKKWSGHRRLNQKKIGVFGFSAGGFTVLVAAGGTPALAQVQAHCARYPQEFTCGVIRQASPQGNLPVPPPGAFVHDSRIAASVVAAPALGFTFGKSGLASLRMPVQLWRAGADDTLPYPFYAQAVADALPVAPEYHVVPGAVHLDFLSPCDAEKRRVAPQMCQSRPGFDRAAFHRMFDLAVTRFFVMHLLG